MKTAINETLSVDKEDWDLVISPGSRLWNIPFKDIWNYRDLLIMLVKRDVVTIYKQTILGPLWIVIQPVLTTLIYMFVFGRVAGMSTDGAPQLLFYLAGITIWNYFAECFNTTSKTFKENAGIYGKVYFPRLITPLSKVAAGLIKFGVQFAFFLVVFLYYLWKDSNRIHMNETIFLLPVYVMLMAIIGLGFGIIFTSLTVKYRDLNFLIQFGVQLVMYASPVIYPLSSIPSEYRWLVLLNPLTPILEGFKYAFLGVGAFEPNMLIFSIAFSLIILFAGILVFNRTERNFIDTI